MTTIILLVLAATLVFFLYRIQRIWRQHFGHRDAGYESFELQRLLAEPAAGEAMPTGTPAAAAGGAAGAGTAGVRLPVLDAPAQEAFLRLRGEFSQVPLLAGTDLAVLTGVANAPRVQVDFVLCRKDFTPAVAILIERSPDPLRERAAEQLRQQGVRVLRWRADAIPSREAMREQIVRPKKG
ncbi:MAG: hypothetical protein REI09_06915 [Candidatus Dactylopiibacterium sp.]|nr:hypothetical protein [Candidatus Dactylopiibacterium sp.]